MLSIANTTVPSFSTRHGQAAEGTQMRLLGRFVSFSQEVTKNTLFIPLTDTALNCHSNNNEKHINEKQIKVKTGFKYIFSISHMTRNTHIHANTSKVTCMWQIKSINGGCVALMTDLSSSLIKCYNMSLPRWDCSVCIVWTEMSSGFLSESRKNYGSLIMTWSSCNELEQLVACLEFAYRASDLLTD